MNIYKTSFISSVETAIKLISGFVLLKLLALHAGPEGVGKFGQFQNFLTIIIMVISGGFVTGLVRFISESLTIKNPSEYSDFSPDDYMAGAFSFGYLASALVSLLLITTSHELSIYIFGTEKFTAIFYLLAASLGFIVIYQIAVAYLNGARKIKELIVIKIISSLSLVFIGSTLIYFNGLVGSLIGLISMQVVAGMFALKVICSLPNFRLKWFKPTFNNRIQLRFSTYWFMSLISLISSALVLILIRTHIVSSESWSAAGLWDAMWKVSELSLLLVTTALVVYYVPMLSSAESQNDQLVLLYKVTVFALISASVISIIIYNLREFVIRFLFSSDFLTIAYVVKFQLIGSVIRIVGWVIGFHMLIKANPKIFIMSELVFGLTFYLLSISLFDVYGILGLSYAFLLNNVSFLLVGLAYLWLYFRKGMFANGL